MIRRDYTEEIGMTPPGRTISWPLAVLILAAVAAAVAWYGTIQLEAFHATHNHHAQDTMAQATATHPTPTPPIAPRHPTHEPPHPAA